MTESKQTRWKRVARKLRRTLGLTPPTPEEADAEMAAAEEVPMSDKKIEAIAKRVTRTDRK